MNSPELNNYIQYVTRSGIVKARSVIFLDNGINTTFDVAGINEDFFIFAVFQNNLQRFGIGFENFDNVNMLSFINSSIVDLACIPTNSFLSSEQVVTMSYNNEYVKKFLNPDSDPLEFPAVQVVHVDNFVDSTIDGAIFSNAFHGVLRYFEATNAFGNAVVDESGYNALNVRIVKQKNEDENFLYEYCKIAFPNNNFVIRPFVHILADGYNLDLNHGTKLYYSYLEASLIEARIFSVGQNQMSPNPFDKRFNPKAKKQLYNRLRFSLGGALPDTPLDYVEMVSGYVAIFDNDITGG